MIDTDQLYRVLYRVETKDELAGDMPSAVRWFDEQSRAEKHADECRAVGLKVISVREVLVKFWQESS